MTTQKSATMQIGDFTYNRQGTTYVMGILNVTPDSFSDGGRYNTVEKAVERALLMERDGADLIDLGGESTRPGHSVITEAEEINRVVPVLKELKKHLKIPVSIDTYKYPVAKAAVEAGADFLNDVYGFKRDPRMAELCAQSGLPCCLMHNRDNQDYEDLLTDMKRDLAVSLELALKAGVKEEQIIIDPGIGFAKNADMNLTVLRNLDQFHELGFPILLGTSRKRFIATALDLPAPQCDEGTAVTSVTASINRCMFVRVHNVQMNKRACRMADVIYRQHEV